MSKLALVAAVLLGACVADGSSTEARLTDDVGPINVVDQVEIPEYTGDVTPDRVTIVITGIEIPGRASTATNIDVNTLLETDAHPQESLICPLADQLDTSNVCSFLCAPEEFAARLNDNGGANPGGCTSSRCPLPGGTIVNFDVCMPPNS